jgi:hypothetical protein
MTDDIETRLAEVERKVQSLVEVCAAVADDTLRMCFVLDEMSRIGKLPPVPWDVATMMVELHHAQQAAKEGLETDEGVSAAQQVERLQAEVVKLREVYRHAIFATSSTGDGLSPT